MSRPTQLAQYRCPLLAVMLSSVLCLSACNSGSIGSVGSSTGSGATAAGAVTAGATGGTTAGVNGGVTGGTNSGTTTSASGGVTGGTSSGTTAGATAAAADSTVLLDRIDLGSSTSEAAHGFNGSQTTAVAGVGAFSQTYRQPMLATWNATPTAAQKITFTIAVDPNQQTYLTVKLWGSDTQFGVIRLDGTTGDDVVAQQLDNNNSSGPSNPPFFGRFHYATTALPISMTAGKTSATISLYSTGYYYALGTVGSPTRPIYSAFTHVNPYFAPPAADQTGTAPVQVGTAPPATVTTAAVYRVLKRSRANIFNLDGVPDGFWNAGGTLARWASVIPPGTTGVPTEAIGMAYGDGKQLTPAAIAAINALPNAADAWRDGVAHQQMGPLSTIAAVYLSPPLTDATGAVVPGYDRYLDPNFLNQIVGILDGLARSQGGSANGLGIWDTGCTGQQRWAGVTSSPRATGPWAGSASRRSARCRTPVAGRSPGRPPRWATRSA